MIKLFVSFVISITFVSVHASFFDPDLDIDIENADMDRIEGWISDFPKNTRVELEKLFKNVLNSETLESKSKIVFDSISSEFQCVNDRMMDGFGQVLATTILAPKKFSRNCIKEIGEKPNLFLDQKFNILQRYKLEKCSLAEFARYNRGNDKFISNLRDKSQSLKTLGAVIKCSSNRVKTPMIYFLESSDYFNALDSLKKLKINCNSLVKCNEKLSIKAKSLIDAWSPTTLSIVHRKELELLDTLLSEHKNTNTNKKLSIQLLWGITEYYNLIRKVNIKNNNLLDQNKKISTLMIKACDIARKKNKSSFIQLAGGNGLVKKANNQYNFVVNSFGSGAITPEVSVFKQSIFSNIKISSDAFGCEGSNKFITDCENNTGMAYQKRSLKRLPNGACP